MPDKTDTRLIAAQLTAALITNTAALDLAASEAVQLYFEVLQALREGEREEEASAPDPHPASFEDKPPGG
jgi:hypothetical protein